MGSVTAPVTADAHFVAGPGSPRRSGRLSGGSRSLRVELTDSKFRGFRLGLWTPILRKFGVHRTGELHLTEGDSARSAQRHRSRYVVSS